MSSPQPATVVTARKPTHTFLVNLAPVNLSDGLKKYGLGGYRAEMISLFKFGEVNLNLFGFLKEGEAYVPGTTMLERSVAEIEGDRFGLPSFIAMLEDQKSIPVELRGQVVIVCEDVLVDGGGYRCLAYAVWLGVRQEWIVLVYGVGDDWGGGDRLARSSGK